MLLVQTCAKIFLWNIEYVFEIKVRMLVGRWKKNCFVEIQQNIFKGYFQTKKRSFLLHVSFIQKIKTQHA